MNKKDKPIQVLKVTPQEVKEITPQNIAQTSMQNTQALINQAVLKGTPIETVERLLKVMKELKADWAKEQFDIAMANFQGDCPVIKKEKAGGKTNSGKVAYYYAPLGTIVSQTQALIKKNGLSYAIKTETKEKGIKVICIAKHIAGHSEESSIEIPLGTKTPVMSESQVTAAAISFATRYAFRNAFGILTGDVEDSGESIPKENFITPAQKELIEKLLVEKDITLERVEQFGKGKIDSWTAGKTKKIIDMLIKKPTVKATKDDDMPTINEDDSEPVNVDDVEIPDDIQDDDIPDVPVDTNTDELLFDKNEERGDK